jgi:endo-1,4-beta-xylanase
MTIKALNMNRLKTLLAALSLIAMLPAMGQNNAPKSILLWPNGAPGSEGKTTPERVSKSARGEISISNVNFPSITPYLPANGKGNGLAIIVAPGGGDKELKMDYEGSNFAEWLAERGIAAFVLKYRLAKEANSTYTVEGHALKDMQRAIRLVRSRAKEWNIDTARIGAMGFSAGGELAGLAAMRFDNGNKNASDAIENQSDKPNVQLLVYPGGVAGLEPKKGSPPLFMVVGNNDDSTRCIGMAELYIKYRKANIPVEFHVFTKAVHGFGVRKTTEGAVADWPNRFYAWLNDMGFLKAATAK